MTNVQPRIYIEKSHHELLKKLAESGTSYEKVAKELNKKGVKTPWGAPVQGHHVGFTLNTLGIRRKVMPMGGKKRSKARRSEQLTGGDQSPSKYDVLRAIESCKDIDPAARRALLDLVWKELNK